MPADKDDTRQTGSFGKLEAIELYCPRCKQSKPVRKHMLPAHLGGDRYEYLCTYCAEPVGNKVADKRDDKIDTKTGDKPNEKRQSLSIIA